jgi:hypothetical protein
MVIKNLYRKLGIIMHSVKALPSDAEEISRIDFKQDRKLLINLNLIGLLVFVFSGWFFWFLASRLATAQSAGFTLKIGPLEIVVGLVSVLLVMVVVVTIHEVIHGVFFWIFTGSRPVFAFKGLYAYAAAPGWYIPRWPFLIVGAAPLVFISLIGVALMPYVSFVAVLFLVAALTLNAGGSIGDMYCIGWLLSIRGNLLIQDYGDGIVVYRLRTTA